MNRQQKRKAIDNLAKQAIKNQSIEVPMGMGIQVSQRIAKRLGGTKANPIKGTIQNTEVIDVQKFENKVKRKVAWQKIKRILTKPLRSNP